MGGIPTNYLGEVLKPKDINDETVVPGLMAIGEASCVSVHGANRLGSNSLLDLIVFGRAAAKQASKLVKPGAKHMAENKTAVDKIVGRLDKIRYSSLIYINDDYEGGELRFENNKIYKLSKNSVIFFQSGIQNRHEVLKITKGLRYTIPLWYQWVTHI